MWVEDLGHLTGDAFLAAIRLARSRSEWFLTPKNILDAHQEIVNKPKEFKQIPEEALTKDQAGARKDWVKKLRESKGV